MRFYLDLLFREYKYFFLQYKKVIRDIKHRIYMLVDTLLELVLFILISMAIPILCISLIPYRAYKEFKKRGRNKGCYKEEKRVTYALKTSINLLQDKNIKITKDSQDIVLIVRFNKNGIRYLFYSKQYEWFYIEYINGDKVVIRKYDKHYHDIYKVFFEKVKNQPIIKIDNSEIYTKLNLN